LCIQQLVKARSGPIWGLLLNISTKYLPELQAQLNLTRVTWPLAFLIVMGNLIDLGRRI